jgi:predicted DNA-binding transcriptional regulator YafY
MSRRTWRRAREERTSEVLRILSSGARVDVPTLARRLGVSNRTVFRYVRDLREAGHHIGSAAGRGGGLFLR